MKQLFLEDLKDMDEKKIIQHLMDQYSGTSDHGGAHVSQSDIEKHLKEKKILIAYESVGSWGCDSSSYFLLRDKKTKQLFEFSGSHCSCYGFEGQFDLQETTVEAIKLRLKNGEVFYTGGYDGNAGENQKAARDFVESLKK